MENILFKTPLQNKLFNQRLKELTKLKTILTSQQSKIDSLARKTIHGAELFLKFELLISQDNANIKSENQGYENTIKKINTIRMDGVPEMKKMMDDPFLSVEAKLILKDMISSAESNENRFDEIIPLLQKRSLVTLTINKKISNEVEKLFFEEILKPDYTEFKFENITNRTLLIIGILVPLYEKINTVKEFLNTFSTSKLLNEKATAADQVLIYLNDFEKSITIWNYVIQEINRIWGNHLLEENNSIN